MYRQACLKRWLFHLMLANDNDAGFYDDGGLGGLLV